MKEISTLSFKDFTVNGITNWKAYKEAQKAIGDVCYQCERYITLNRNAGKKTLCNSCREAHGSTDSIQHNKLIRCPKCNELFEPVVFRDFDIYEEGEHDLDCPKCKYFFIVETTVTYTFESPAMMDLEDEDEDYDDIVVESDEE